MEEHKNYIIDYCKEMNNLFGEIMIKISDPHLNQVLIAFKLGNIDAMIKNLPYLINQLEKK
jgi:intein-encoded DNA endonuclease-like protein